MCQKFEKSPQNCVYLNNQYKIKKANNHSEESRGLFIFVNVIVFLLLLTFSAFILYLVYQKIYKNMLANRVEEIVRD